MVGRVPVGGDAPISIQSMTTTKTADVDTPPYKLAGLVVDPTIHPKAFKADKAAKARDCWAAMKPLMGTVYKVDTNHASKHYGCLQLQGSYIHGDYDLYDVIDITQANRNLAAVEVLLGQPHRRGAKVLTVQEFINSRIGSPMIQHGGEAQYADHSEQAIDAFGPEGEDVTILNEFSVRGWRWPKSGWRPQQSRAMPANTERKSTVCLRSPSCRSASDG